MLYCALIAYIVFEGPKEDRNINTLADIIGRMEVKENDENFRNAVDYMFGGLKKRKPDCFAVKQYMRYRLGSGLAAVSMFKENADRYSLMLMDIHMHKMDGFEATRRIRALEFPQAKNIPIVAMTASVFREDIENCLAAGMNDHIGKPVDREDLFAKLEQYIS